MEYVSAKSGREPKEQKKGEGGERGQWCRYKKKKNNFKCIERPFSLVKTRTKQAIRVALLFITNKKVVSVYSRFNFLIKHTVMPTARRTKRGFPFPFSATYRRTRAESTFLVVHHLSLDECFSFFLHFQIRSAVFFFFILFFSALMLGKSFIIMHLESHAFLYRWSTS